MKIILQLLGIAAGPLIVGLLKKFKPDWVAKVPTIVVPLASMLLSGGVTYLVNHDVGLLTNVSSSLGGIGARELFDQLLKLTGFRVSSSGVQVDTAALKALVVPPRSQ